MDNTRTKGVIDKVETGWHDGDFPHYIVIGIDDEAGYQCMIISCNDQQQHDEALAQLRRLFMVDDNDKLVGCDCYALRYFPEHNTPVAGLEAANGARWTLSGFSRSQGFKPSHPLQQERERRQSEIAWMRRRIAEEQERLDQVEERMAAWLEEELPRMGF
jgi:hypothetical protein